MLATTRGARLAGWRIPTHTHPPAHEHSHGWSGFIKNLAGRHSHDAKDSLDQALEGSTAGIRTVTASLVILLVTAGVQALVVAASGSVALLGDTLHNGADALSAVPLFLAFRVTRRPPTRRFTYGFGKAEDLAGVLVIALIAASAVLAAYEAAERLVHPQSVTHLGFVMAAAVIGAVGNEVVAQYRIRTGRRIGSAALEADGLHARTDGVTSLLVLVGAVGVALGLPWADPLIGLVIAAAIAGVGWQAVRSIGGRLLDAVDPSVIEEIGRVAAATPGVLSVSEVRARWMGHRLLAQVRLGVVGALSVTAAHGIAEETHHRLLHEITNLSDAIIHVDPEGTSGDPHAGTRHHTESLPPPA
ncbi:MAG TPA: cation diffusion facilitator family transporter [Acidimicrobiales bacterium]|nr:cation diffusion facilitator family transporter [Acidimicrobiales bacterium]